MKDYLFSILFGLIVSLAILIGCTQEFENFEDEVLIIPSTSLDSIPYQLDKDILMDVKVTLENMNKSINKDLTLQNVSELMKVESKSTIGDVIVLKMAINLGENFLYKSGDRILMLFIIQNGNANECSYLSLSESCYLQSAEDISITTQVFPELESTPSGYYNSFWNIVHLSPYDFQVFPITYIAPEVDTFSSFATFTSFIKKHPFNFDVDKTNNIRRVVVAIKP